MESVGQASQAVCYENIGPRERARRARFGYLALAFGVALAVVLVLSGAERAWRLLVFFPIAGGATSWLQAREHTWVSLAALGQRNMDDGQERVEDPWLRARLRRQARGIVLKASLAGAAVAALAMLLP